MATATLEAGTVTPVEELHAIIVDTILAGGSLDMASLYDLRQEANKSEEDIRRAFNTAQTYRHYGQIIDDCRDNADRVKVLQLEAAEMRPAIEAAKAKAQALRAQADRIEEEATIPSRMLCAEIESLNAQTRGALDPARAALAKMIWPTGPDAEYARCNQQMQRCHAEAADLGKLVRGRLVDNGNGTYINRDKTFLQGVIGGLSGSLKSGRHQDEDRRRRLKMDLDFARSELSSIEGAERRIAALMTEASEWSGKARAAQDSCLDWRTFNA